jgi:hypothetical protein
MTNSTPIVTAWSYSRYADYKQCPAKFKFKHIERRPDPGSPAMNRGNEIHKLAEDYVRAKLGEVPDELKEVANELNFLKDNYAVVEEQWGFRTDWEWIGREGWFGADVWFRAKTDVRLLYDDDTLLLGDWKTGKMYFSNEEQIELFALAGYRRFPFVTEVDTRLWYTDVPAGQNEIHRTYTAQELEAIQKDWTKRVVPMFKDKRFAPTPNDKCGWCPFSKAKGGPCRF